MADKSIQEKFVMVAVVQINSIKTMINNANDAGLTKTTSNNIMIILDLIKVMEKEGKQASLVEMFIAKSEYWNIVENKDVKGIRDALPLMFAGLPVGKDDLAVPIDVYLSERSRHTKKSYVISEKNIEALWANLEKLIKASIIYDHENGSALKDKHNLGKWYDKYAIGK